MANIKSDALLDYAVFQLSPRRSRCELFISCDGSTEKIASGLLKPFVSHLQIAEDQVSSAAESVKLEVGRHKDAETWFTKGTLERFVRFVSTPEVLELVNTLDAEMSQLEAARRIYSQGVGDHLSGGGRGSSGATSGDDATKKEVVRAMEVRLVAARQDLSSACARAAAAGFNLHTVSQLYKFADTFGAHRLIEACSKFASLNERRPELTHSLKSEPDDRAVRSSYGSDMSIDDDASPSPPPRCVPAVFQRPPDPIRTAFSRESSIEWEPGNKSADWKDESSTPNQPESIQASQPSRRLSVHDRINMFENKQKETSGGKPVELRRLSAAGPILRRWSGASDMSIDLSVEKKDGESPVGNPASAEAFLDVKIVNLNDHNNAEASSVAKMETKVLPSLSRGGLSGISFASSEQFEDRQSSEDELRSSAIGRNESIIGLGNQSKLKGEEFGGFKTQMAGFKDQFPLSANGRLLQSKSGEQCDVSNQRESPELRDEFVKEVGLKTAQKTSEMLDVGAGSRIRQAFAFHLKGVEGDCPSAQQKVRPARETEVAEKKESRTLEKASRVEVTPTGKTEVGNKESHIYEKGRVQQGGSGNRQFSGQVTAVVQEGPDSFSTPTGQSERVRQSKGNQELNELKMKATQLEKMFAEHKLRVPGDQPNSARKGRLGDTPREPSRSLQYTKPVTDGTSQLLYKYQSTQASRVSKNSIKFDISTPMKAVDGQYDTDTMTKKFSDLGVSESSRGKFYDRYMQKRDAKLRDGWSANREEKEARLKSMQDSLERNRSDMKAKNFGSMDTKDSVSSAHQRAERLRSYNSRSIVKMGQQNLEFEDSDDDEEAL